MSIEEELAGMPAKKGSGTTVAAIRRMRYEVDIPVEVLQVMERKGADLGRWGIAPTVDEIDGVLVTTYTGATLVMQELTASELKSCTSAKTEYEAEVQQVRRQLVSFGDMDVTDKVMEHKAILDFGGIPMFQLLIASGNAVLFGGAGPEVLSSVVKAAGAGRMV